MFLSKLSVCGFKSFAQASDIRFKDGLMGVVGPNGCGKSNIVDAIRWVMGEQRPSVLRCNMMEDVIFNGSRSRKAVGMAEVSITIQNTRNLLPIEYNEVTITRRLYRSGESEYLINNNQCRLKDIHNIFMDTGMGSQSYSVIEQSMEDALLSDKTENRRILFDEAAGIMKYKTRQKETLRKLMQTSDDLVRINDILMEVQKKTESLKRQVNRAERYKEFTGQLRKTDLYLASNRYHAFTDEMGPLEEERSTCKTEAEEWDRTIAGIEARGEELRLELLEKEKSLSTAQERVDGKNQEFQNTEKVLITLREKRNSLDGIIERARTEVEALKGKHRTQQQTLDGYRDQLTPLADQLQEMRNTCGREEEQYAAFEEDFREKKAAIDEKRSQLWRQMDLFSAESQEMQKTIFEKENLEKGLERISHEQEALAVRISETELKLEELHGQRRELNDTIALQLAEREDIAARITQQREDIENLRLQEGELLTRLKSREYNLSILQKMKAEYEGFTTGVRSLIKEENHVSGIKNVVADVIHTPKEYSQAMESVLGSSLQYLISDNINTASQAISYLQQNQKGKATLIASDRFTRFECDIDYTSLLHDEGVIGAAWDLIEPDTEYSNIVKYLLKDVVLVRDMDTAFRLLDSAPSSDIRFVTPEGQVLQSGGIITGGSTGADDAGLIGREDEIRELETDIERLRGEHHEIQLSLENGTRALEELSLKIKNADELGGQNQRALTTLEKEIVELEMQDKNLQQQSDRLTADREQHQVRMEECELRHLELEEKNAGFNKEASEQEIRAAEEELAVLQNERDERSGRLQQIKMALINLENDSKHIHTNITNLQEALADTTASMDRNSAEIIRAISQVVELDRETDTNATLLESVSAEKTELERQRDNFRTDYQELFVQVDELDKKMRSDRRSRQEKADRLHQIEMRHQKIEMELEQITEHIRETYQMDISTYDASELAEEFSSEERTMDDIKNDHAMLKEKIERLGPVNLLALDEYEQEKDRLEFLAEQHTDLVEAKETLERTLQKINKTARIQFIETFDQIRANFEMTYSKFFDGGIGKVKLEEGIDPLESDIIIHAQPKGKNLRHISLMSGGERALTAIALLFAIYLVKPSPFCILDEVDAPLDDANLGRFLNVITEFSKQTQFIVVTHNKKTMEAGSCLYGVTMPEEGVSQIVSVKF